MSARADLPPLSYVLKSSPGPLHVFWRVANFSSEGAERLQKHFARQLGTDLVATSCSQTTRIAGYQNHKRTPSHRITVRYGWPEPRYTLSRSLHADGRADGAAGDSATRESQDLDGRR